MVEESVVALINLRKGDPLDVLLLGRHVQSSRIAVIYHMGVSEPQAPQSKSGLRYHTHPTHPPSCSCFPLLSPIPCWPSMASSLARYESFLIHNVSTISSLESTLRSLTWLLPGRFKDAELISEACSSTHSSLFFDPPFTRSVTVYASLNSLSLYHDTLLNRAVGNEPKYRPLLPPSLHSRFTRAWADTHTRYRWTARTLELIRFVQLLLEMALRRRVAAKSRWRAITLLEAIK
jgi:hypothetical protein